MVDYEVIVVGGGIMGSATGYHLAKQGKKTLILEQFPLPQTRGGSHGEIRMLRRAYRQEHYREMMKESVTMWEEIEREANTDLMKACQMLLYGEDGSVPLLKAEETLQKSKCSYEKLSPAELQARYPGMNFKTSHAGVLDHEAGIQQANKCLPAIQDLFSRHGGKIQDGESVTKIEPGDIVQVFTNRGKYSCNSLILTPGAWAKSLMKSLDLDLPITLLGLSAGFWKRKDGSEAQSLSNSPLLVAQAGTVDNIHALFMYGLPAEGYPYHFKADIMDEQNIDLDSETSSQVDEKTMELLMTTVKKNFPGMEDFPRVTERGIEAMTPDREIILDNHPTWRNIVIGAGFSGHGYKLAPVVGKILAQLATGITPEYDISALKIDRFNQKTT